MKNLGQAVIGMLALVGIGAAGYRTYKLRKMEKEQQIIEVAVETAPDEPRK